MMDLPRIVFIDARVAAQMPTDRTQIDPDSSAEMIPYIHRDAADEMVREVRNESALPDEYLVQLAVVDGELYGLSNRARLWARGQVAHEGGDWHLISNCELRG